MNSKQRKAYLRFANDPHVLAMKGGDLKQAAAIKLEDKLKSNSRDTPSRLKLLGYWWKASFSSKSADRKRLQIITWLIKNTPEQVLLSAPECWIEKRTNPADYEKCKKLWLAQLKKHKDNAAVIGNAAKFLRYDTRLAEKLFRQAVMLDPKNADWSRDLAWFLKRRGRKNPAMMKRALAAIQDAIEKTDQPKWKRHYYNDLAEIAFDVYEWKIAQEAAEKSVSSATAFGSDWYEGNAIHDGNCVLGRIALRKGNLKKAVHYLDEASKTKGSPQLNSFGPNMRFAQELLKAGERKAVISYIEGCKKFWEGRDKILADCIEQIEKGKSPKLPRVV